jgi:hypothetical protein
MQHLCQYEVRRGLCELVTSLLDHHALVNAGEGDIV